MTGEQKSVRTIEQLLAEEGVYLCPTVGKSMEPLLRERRDTVQISALRASPRRYDVVLYRREGVYILHRIVRVLKDGGYVIRGDHCLQNEYDISAGQVLGVMTAFWRGNRFVRTTDLRYRLWVRLHCALYPVRRGWHAMRALGGRVLRRLGLCRG